MTNRNRLATALFLTVIVPAITLAQVDTGTITGMVRDPGGAVIPGARILVKQVETNQQIETSTNEQGLFTAPQLKIGSYQVSASVQGFKTEVRSGIVLNVQQVIRLEFDMRIGDIAESVAVTADPSLLETGTASLGQVVYEKVIKDLPLNGRNYLQLAKLSAGDSAAGRPIHAW